MPESFRVSAPGKLMLLGEHAVLHGHPCLVCAVNQRMFVTLKKRSDSTININSDLGQFSTSLKNMEIHPSFKFVLRAIEQEKDFLSSGFDLTITSDFSHNVGLGSSAAITAAMTAALFSLTQQKLDKNRLFDKAFHTIRTIQGTGSGADLAASVYGGLLLYQMQPQKIQSLNATYPITVVYSGSKTPTVEVINRVNDTRQYNAVLFDKIFELVGQCAESAAEAIQAQNWPRLGQLLNINQGLMDAIGVNNKILSDIVYDLRNDPEMLGAKISGSGLGDCVIGLGTLKQNNLPYQFIPLQISSQGVLFD